MPASSSIKLKRFPHEESPSFLRVRFASVPSLLKANTLMTRMTFSCSVVAAVTVGTISRHRRRGRPAATLFAACSVLQVPPQFRAEKARFARQERAAGAKRYRAGARKIRALVAREKPRLLMR